MQRRATSKKRAAEADKEVDMGDKEATPVEDPEVLEMCIRDKVYVDVYVSGKNVFCRQCYS